MPLTEYEKISVILKEYETLRAEIIERLRLAHQQLAWAGAVIAFAIPVTWANPAISENTRYLAIGCAAVAVFFLGYLSFLNWTWLRQVASHVKAIEDKIARMTSEPISTDGKTGLLTWEHRMHEIGINPLMPPNADGKR